MECKYGVYTTHKHTDNACDLHNAYKHGTYSPHSKGSTHVQQCTHTAGAHTHHLMSSSAFPTRAGDASSNLVIASGLHRVPR